MHILGSARWRCLCGAFLTGIVTTETSATLKGTQVRHRPSLTYFYAALGLRSLLLTKHIPYFFVLVVVAVNIEFLTEFGDLPLLRSDLSAIRNIDPYLATLQNDYIMNITEYQKGMHT